MGETIAAIATAPGAGGIAVLRISGKNSIDIAGRVFKGKTPLSEVQSHLMQYGKAVQDGKVLDECLCVVMRSPRSFTGEDVVEIHCHGGQASATQILDALITSGARLALPGEFSKRAFLNGRLDLAEAEAISDIISARTSAALYAAVNQLEGALSEKINALRESLLDICARLGVLADYPEDDIDPFETNEIIEKLDTVLGELNALLKTAETGRLLRRGATCAIVGRPNTGKSSILNYLVGENRAIVTAHAGTTRDIIEEQIDVFGIPVRLADTAGIRENAGEIEGMGIELSKKYMQNADVCVLVLDGSAPLDENDKRLLALMEGRRHLVAINKSDLPKAVEDIEGAVNISAKTGAGMDRLLKELYDILLSGSPIGSFDLSINLRHKESILAAIAALKRARETLSNSFPADIISVDLEEALTALGEITGQTVSDEIVEKIFSSFCLGK